MPGRVEPIQAHAAENLQFIRDAMARASAFTVVPGWGGVLIGVTALAAAISGPPDGFAALGDGLVRRRRRRRHDRRRRDDT